MKRLSLNTQSIAIISILLVAGTLFTWSALHNGWMNDYYSAAAVSGHQQVYKDDTTAIYDLKSDLLAK